MADYPDSIYEPRVKENKSGVKYEPERKTILFAEDISKDDDEIVAIETELGENPKGTSASVLERIKGIRSLSDADADVIVVKGGNVGIGMTTPGTKLDISGGVLTVRGYGNGITRDLNGEILLGSTETYRGRIAMDAYTGSTTWYFDSTYDNAGSKILFRTRTAGTPVSALTILGSGNVGIGTTSPNADAILDIVSTTKAFMPPRMTTAQRDAIASPAAGMVIYNTTTKVLNFYNGAAWGAV